MKIIGTQHDFYDSARCYTFCSDSEVVFIRKQEEKEVKFERENHINFNFPLEATELVIIGFCGKIYPVLRVITDINHYERKEHYFYDVNSYYDFISDKNNWKKIHITNYWWQRKRTSSWKNYVKNFDKEQRVKNRKYGLNPFNFNYSIRKTTERQDAEDAFEFLRNRDDIKELFLEHKCPYFILKEERHNKLNMVINPVLKNYEFFKVVDPRIAYQEIEMFFNSVLVGEANPPQIENDIILAEKKGFDKKISFRHRTSKKKKHK